MGKKPKYPKIAAPPTYAQMLQQNLQAQASVMPQELALEQQYAPQWATLYSDISAQLSQADLDQLKQLYPQVAQLESAYETQTTADELARLKQFLPQYQQTLQALTPGAAASTEALGKLAEQASARALQRPEFRNYLSDVAGPASGQFVGQVAQYAPGQEVGAVQGPQEVGYMQAIRGPRITSGLERISQPLVQQYVRSMPGMEQYAQTLAQTAQRELEAGRSLTPEEERMAQQASREAYAARGTVLGGQAAAAEVLNRADVANRRFAQRMATAQQAAGQVQGLYAPALEQALQRQQIGAQYGLSSQAQRFAQAQAKESLAQQIQQSQFQQAMAREQLAGTAQAQQFQQAMGREELAAGTQAQQFAQAGQRQAADIALEQAATQAQAAQGQLASGALGQVQGFQSPILQAYYQQPMMTNLPLALQSGAATDYGLTGPQYFNPESQPGMAAQTGAWQAEAQNRLGMYNAKMGAWSGRMAMAGKILGGICWVAREVYGVHNPKWIEFRKWMLEKAPKWMLNGYIKHGAKIALFIKNKPLLKHVIKCWMDSKLA